MGQADSDTLFFMFFERSRSSIANPTCKHNFPISVGIWAFYTMMSPSENRNNVQPHVKSSKSKPSVQKKTLLGWILAPV
jgi:hypothetical protein